MERPSKELVELVGRRIRELRSERALTQEQLCTRAGISVDAVTRIERGKRVPTLATLEHLARAFGVRLTAFFDGAAPPSEQVVPAAMRKVALLLARQPNDVLALAENAVTAVVRAYGAGTARGAAPPAPRAAKHPLPHPGSARGAQPPPAATANRRRRRSK